MEDLNDVLTHIRTTVVNRGDLREDSIQQVALHWAALRQGYADVPYSGYGRGLKKRLDKLIPTLLLYRYSDTKSLEVSATLDALDAVLNFKINV